MQGTNAVLTVNSPSITCAPESGADFNAKDVWM